MNTQVTVDGSGLYHSSWSCQRKSGRTDIIAFLAFVLEAIKVQRYGCACQDGRKRRVGGIADQRSIEAARRGMQRRKKRMHDVSKSLCRISWQD